ncbi:MAG: methyltransferase domain-containing protein [Nanoarchaeota archaeon]|nr:methyltransferase domain-containing protein [Nanoarchaeota archaeon]
MAERKVQKLLIEEATGKKYLVKSVKEDFHTAEGTIAKADLQSGKTIVHSNRGKRFLSLNPTFPDLWELLNRGPQIILQKDVGLILAKTGVNKNSLVVDAGGGSGSLTFSLANVCKHVFVYENNPAHFALLEKNTLLFGLKNVTLKQKDVYQGIDEKDLDLITLDLPEPWNALQHAEKALKPGAFLVVYLPNLHQVHQFIQATRKTNVRVLETLELLERKWQISEKIMRPEFQMLGHTGFLIFCRRL